MTHVKYKKIEEVGLKHHLEATRSRHGDLGYDEFVDYYQRRKINQLNMSKLFLVQRSVMRKWIAIYEKEQHDA